MRFQPKSEKEIAQGALLAPGQYDFDVLKAADETSSNGNEMIHLTLKFYGPEGTTIVHDYLLEKVAYKLRHFAYAVGLGIKYEAGTLEAIDCEDRSGKAALRIVEDKAGKYPPKNDVQDYITPEDYQDQKDAVQTAVMKQNGAAKKEPAIQRAEHKPLNDDDIPF